MKENVKKNLIMFSDITVAKDVDNLETKLARRDYALCRSRTWGWHFP